MSIIISIVMCIGIVPDGLDVEKQDPNNPKEGKIHRGKDPVVFFL